MSFADQSGHSVRFEWGLHGLRATASDAIVVLVDIHSFTTSVSIACGRGAIVWPCAWNPSLAGQRVSPSTLINAAPGAELVLPSQNGSALAYEAMREGRTVIAASIRNAGAVAAWLRRQHSPVAVIACGERWPDDTWRFSVEDLIGAGAVIAQLGGDASPEAASAAAAFNAARTDLFAPLRNCSSGRELMKRGFERDVVLASELNAERSVPLLVQSAFRAAPSSE